MSFKSLPHGQWPCENMREFVAIIHPKSTIESIQPLISEMSEILLGRANPPVFETFADVLVAASLFPSKGQANKAGANTTEIPDGLSVFCIGKLKTHIWIWKPVAESV